MKLLIICGPTATGKTAIALELAKKFNGELVSADSRQVYKDMDIGTGKDIENAKCQMTNDKYQFKNKDYNLVYYLIEGVKLWMYDVVNPDEEFSVGHYQYLAQQVIDNIRNRGKLPIIVGGTGLYIKSLIFPIETVDIPPDTELRKQLAGRSAAELAEELRELAPEIYGQMNDSDSQNPRRLVRKIEIAYVQGRALKQEDFLLDKQKVLVIGLTAPLPVLYQRIDDRVEKRVKQGIVEEIKSLLNKGYTWDLPAMSGLGYREWRMTNDELRMMNDECKIKIIEQWKKDERDYARRQMTWFKKQPGINWFDITNPNFDCQVVESVQAWYTKNND